MSELTPPPVTLPSALPRPLADGGAEEGMIEEAERKGPKRLDAELQDGGGQECPRSLRSGGLPPVPGGNAGALINDELNLSGPDRLDAELQDGGGQECPRSLRSGGLPPVPGGNAGALINDELNLSGPDRLDAELQDGCGQECPRSLRSGGLPLAVTGGNAGALTNDELNPSGPDRLDVELQDGGGQECPRSLQSVGLPPVTGGNRSGTMAEPMVKRRGFFEKVGAGMEWVFGFAALLVLVAGCSVVPVLNFLSLGYLLQVSGTVARTGRFRDGFIGVRKAAVLGSLAAGTWIVVWPARLVSKMWKDAELIAPGSGVARAWHAGLVVVIAITLVHLFWSCVRGGKLRHFLWPQPLRFMRWLRTAQKFEGIQNQITDYVVGLHLPTYFWLGLRGFVGALAWLIVPVGILLAATRLPLGGSVLLSLLGGLLLLVVAIHLPFLQARFAESGRFGAMFELREVRRLFLRAPLAFWFSLIITLLFAVPLYLLKIELTPKELAWLPSLLFVIFIFPARVLTGWAMHRAMRHEQPRHWFARWVARLGIVPVAVAYTVFVYFMPYVSWNGAWSLLEQHAFLVPAPLMAL